MKKIILLSSLLIAFAVFVFYSPQIDNFVANLVFNDRHFYCDGRAVCDVVFYSVPCIVALIIVAAVVLLALVQFASSQFIQAHKWKFRRLAIVTLLALLVGPGLLINAAFKEHWGRPRPDQVMLKNEHYASVWQPHFDAPSDNSFPSGHASIGFFLGMPLLILGYRKQGLVLGTLAGIVFGWFRIMQGAHYASDVVFAGIFVWLSTEFCIKVFDFLSHKIKRKKNDVIG